MPIAGGFVPEILLVCGESVEELAFYSVGSFESPCEGDCAVCEEVFDGVLGVEDVEEALFVGVVILL